MFSIDILAVGRLKNDAFSAAAADYIQRLGPYAKLTVSEVKSSPITDSFPATRSSQEESARIMDVLKDDDVVIAMDARGKQLRSEKFADLLKEEGSSGRRLRFVIGGTAGLRDEVLKRAATVVSLSDMTFPHELARVMILEQLYRAVTILKGKKYHY